MTWILFFFRSRGGPPSRRSSYRVMVSGLPPSGSWQDLKDHMREAGDVCYADVSSNNGPMPLQLSSEYQTSGRFESVSQIVA